MNRRNGLTLIELVLASALFSLLMVAVFQLIESSLSLWRRGEVRRNLLEQTTTVAELLARDLRTLEGGQSGDLLIEWVRFDADKDGAWDAKWPRIRMVRQVSPAERSLLYELTAKDRAEALAAQGIQVDEASLRVPDLPRNHGLAEVVWVIQPPAGKDADSRGEGIIWRGERLAEDHTTMSFFDEGFLGRSNRVPSAVLEEVSGGLLWMNVLCAAQTSIVRDEWKQGDGLGDVATSWDGWNRARPDVEQHFFNESHPGMPPVVETPVFPRRIRFEFEFERPADRRDRTRLSETMAATDSDFEVEQPERVPRGDDAYVLIGAEWMKVQSVFGNTVSVRRAQRGTEPAIHEPGAMVHHGMRMVREVPLSVYKEDWNL